MQSLSVAAVFLIGCVALDSMPVETPARDACAKYGSRADERQGKIDGFRHLDDGAAHKVLIRLPESTTEWVPSSDPRHDEVVERRSRDHLASRRRVMALLGRYGARTEKLGVLDPAFNNLVVAEVTWDQVVEIAALPEVQEIHSSKTCIPPPSFATADRTQMM